MPRVRVHDFSISIDGYGAGPHQSTEEPLGVGGEALHDWVVSTRSWQKVHGQDGGTGGVDDDFTSGSMTNVGAWIMGRNMFGAERGPWRDMDWKGWWGKNPPYHVPVFVLTHHPRESIEMEGGTTFHFVTGGIHEAMERAREAAGEADIRIGGGAATIRQYLEARLIDEMHFAVSPVLLGSGEPLLVDLDLPALGYRCREHQAGEKAAHYVIARAE
jgi:dihydrofolate reductase